MAGASNSLEINLNSLTVLIADENDGARRILNELLHAIGGREVYQTSTFAQAEQFIKAEPVDLFVCDLHLGDERGPELIKTVREMETHRNSKIPIMLTCSHTRTRELQSARDCGANMLLAKPYSVSALYDRLAWVAHRPRPFVRCEVYNGPDRRFKDQEIEQEDRRGQSAPNDQADQDKKAAS